MPRTARRNAWSTAACYQILNRGHARETVFHDDDDRVRFLELLARYRHRFGFRLCHCCLMDNHFNLLLQLPEASALSTLLAGLLVAYWHHYRRRYGLVGHLFEGRCKTPAVETEGYLLSCGRYIERNPLAADLVSVPWEYRWSSCRAYALGESNGLLAENPWYQELAPEPDRRQELWQAFVLEEDPKEEEVQRQDWTVGTEAFRRRMRQAGARPEPRRQGGPARKPAAQ